MSSTVNIPRLIEITQHLPLSALPDMDGIYAHKNAELAFTGAMLNYLIGEGYHRFEFDAGETDSIQPSLTLYDLPPFIADTVVEMLAMACMCVGERQATR